MAATLTLSRFGRIAAMGNMAAVKVSFDANSVSYATSLGGLLVDLYSVLASAGPFSAPPNGNDVVSLVPLGLTSPGKFMVTGKVTLGTVTSTAIPAYVQIGATGTAASAGLAEIADGVCTQTFDALVILARGGTN